MSKPGGEDDPSISDRIARIKLGIGFDINVYTNVHPGPGNWSRHNKRKKKETGNRRRKSRKRRDPSRNASGLFLSSIHFIPQRHFL